MLQIRKLHFIIVVCFILITIQSSSSQNRFDVIHLKSGGKIIGRIIDKTEKQSIHIELHSKEIIVVSWDNIKDIEDLVLANPILTSSVALVPSESSTANDTTWEVVSRDRIVASNVKLDSLKGQYLFVSKGHNADSLEIVTIKELRLVKKSHFVTYTIGGTLIGAAGGALIGHLSEGSSEGWGAMVGAIGGGVLGFVCGSIVGITQGNDIIIDMHDDNFVEAQSRIEKLFRNENHK